MKSKIRLYLWTTMFLMALRVLVVVNKMASTRKSAIEWRDDHRLYYSGNVGLHLWRKEFKTIVVNTGRQTGHTTAISKMASRNDLVVFSRKQHLDDFRRAHPKCQATLMSSSNCAHQVRLGFSGRSDQQIYRKVFIDLWSHFDEKSIASVNDYLNATTTYDTQLICLS